MALVKSVFSMKEWEPDNISYNPGKKIYVSALKYSQNVQRFCTQRMKKYNERKLIEMDFSFSDIVFLTEEEIQDEKDHFANPILCVEYFHDPCGVRKNEKYREMKHQKRTILTDEFLKREDSTRLILREKNKEQKMEKEYVVLSARDRKTLSVRELNRLLKIK